MVISIIALLVGLLLPALGQARKMAWKGACASNQRQIGYAMHMYATEFGDYIPREGQFPVQSYWATGSTFQFYQWPRAFFRYVMEKDPSVHNGAGRTFNGRDLGDPNWRSYQFQEVPIYKDPAHPNPNHQIQYINNGLMVNRDGQMMFDGKHPTALIDEFQRPADAMYLTAFTDDRDNEIYEIMYNTFQQAGVDAVYDVFTPDHVNGPEDGANPWIGNVARISSVRHETGSNALFIDGHVELRQADTLKDVDNWDDRTYNIVN